MHYEEKNQEILKEFLIKNVHINSIDDRGWYIVASGINGGVHYLYPDGNIRIGVNNNGISAFWPSEEAANIFFNTWKVTDNEFWDGLGNT